MRTILITLTITFALVSITGAQDYFPLREGNQWTYTMSNGVEMTMKITGFSEIDGVRCATVESTIKSLMGSDVSREYLAIDSEGLKAYMAMTQGQQLKYDPPVIRIKLPFQQGQTWTATMNQSGMSLTSTFQSVGIQDVLTQAGNFKCIEISSKLSVPGQGTITSESYYADGTGLVLQRMQVSGQTITSSLSSSNVKPTEKLVTPPKPAVTPAQTQQMKCPNCGAVVSADAKFCPECGAKLTRPAPPAAPTVCPKCGAKLSAGAKFCPECGEKLEVQAAGNKPPQETIYDANNENALEKYLSPMGTIMLYKPHSWDVVEQNLGEGVYAVSIEKPDETAVVVFITLPVKEDINDSVSLAGACLKEFKDEIPDLEGKNVKSTSDKSRTIMDITFTEEGEKGVGHGYFFYTQKVGTVYLLLARSDVWNELRPTLIKIASNIAYTPKKIVDVVKQGREIAAQTTTTSQERVINPAAMLQKAKNNPGKQLQLVTSSLSDQSLTFQIPQGWNLKGQELQYSLTENPQTKDYGMSSVSYTIIPSEFSVSGAINAPYQPPPQALNLVLQFNKFGTNPEILAEVPGEQVVPGIAQSVQGLRAQGYQVDSRLLHVKFKNMSTGTTLRGLFSVQCMTMSMSPVWQVYINGSWSPDNEYDEWLPLYLRIGDTYKVNQTWAQADIQNRNTVQQQLNRNLQNSIAGANQAFDDYMGSLQNADRSRDYSSWMWSQTTLGQGAWVANNEGAEVYQTDSYGIEGPQGRIDSPAYNTTNFTGVSPWNQNQLELIDTRAEFEKYMAGN